MPDLSADRPLLLPDLFTEDDVILIADAIGSRAIARIALRVLNANGRLLAPSAEHREEEFTVEYVHPMDREYRRQRMEPCMRTLAEVVEYAAGLRTVGYIDVKLYRRSRAVDAGPWVEVDRSPTDA